MAKFVVLILVLAVVIGWLVLGRKRLPPSSRASAKRDADPAKPAAMLACAHCGVHLPQPEAVFDVGGRPYCTEAHRLAGPA